MIEEGTTFCTGYNHQISHAGALADGALAFGRLRGEPFRFSLAYHKNGYGMGLPGGAAASHRSAAPTFFRVQGMNSER
jgi:hypothetical protein